jgi:spermidine dehydrogenase
MPTISRRDFLNGVALTVAAGVTPWDQIRAQPMRYPPALTGMRGHHPGSFEVAHELARDGKVFAFDSVPIEEHYDLVVVGGGISGLSAAYFYRKAHPTARILILDNHDDFGGHAKRNEFHVGDRLIIGYGGSEAIQSPRSLWSDTAKGLLRELNVDVTRFETAFEQKFYTDLGLSRGTFFARETFGRDALVAGDPSGAPGEGGAAPAAGKKSRAEYVAAFPISDASKAQIVALYESTRDPLAGKSTEEKAKILKATSYRDFLVKLWGCSEEAANCFQGRPLGFFGLGADSVAAADLQTLGYPGFQGLGLPKGDHDAAYSEPYIYHFPDGNASLARLLVRALIPGVAPGSTMEDVVLAPFDYSKLDDAANAVRIRLDSTCLSVRNVGQSVELGYSRDRGLHRVAADHVVLACFHMIIPYIMPELPDEQRDALAHNVKTPLVYSNVVIRNWQPFVRLKVHDIAAPMSFHTRVKLDFPVNLGGYAHPRDPAGPICLHMVHVPGEPNQGLDARSQFRIGRLKLLDMTFADFEGKIRGELDRMLGSGGFSAANDIAAITVNRWSHGYSYVANSLFDPDDYDDVVARARQPFKRVTIANTDAGGDAYAHLAIDAAARAVRELG